MALTWRPKRRGFVVAAAAALVLAGCGGTGGDDSPGDGSGDGVAEGEIDPDAVLKFTYAGPVPLLDPMLQPSYGMQGYVALIYDRLMMVDKDDQLIPGLAEEWSFAEDGSYLDLDLREDVTFHDDTPFDAEAVKANIERGKTLEGSTIVSDLEDISEVEVVDEHTARLHLQGGGGVALPSVLATNTGMMISPTVIDDDSQDLSTDTTGAGSGPYVVTEFVPNEKLVVEKAGEDYWDPDAGLLGGIEIEPVPEADTRLNGVESGQADLTFVSSANELARAEELADGGFNFVPVPYRNTIGMMLRADQGDLSEPQVRQAVAHAIDPEEMSALFSGMCTPHQDMYPDGEWPTADDYEYPYSYDPERAAELVDEVGGAEVSLSYPAGTNVELPANAIESSLSEVGIDAQLNPVPNSESEARFIAGDYEAYVSNSYVPAIDPAETVDTFLLGRYGLAAEPDLIEDAADTAADPALAQEDREPLYEEIFATALEEAWYIPVCQLTVGAVANEDVLFAENIPWASIGIWDLRYVAMKAD